MTPGGGVDLTDRRAIVTGAGTGIGRATASELVGAGAIVLREDMHEHLAEECVDVILRIGGRAIARQFDVRFPVVFDEVVRSSAAAGGGRLDIVANIAGAVVGRGPVAEISDEDLDNGLDLNLKSLVYGTRAAGRILRAQGQVAVRSSTHRHRWCPGGTVVRGQVAGFREDDLAFCDDQFITMPPLTLRVCPVMYDADSEQRNSTVAAAS